MPLGTTAANDLLLNWLNSTALSWTANGNVYISLHVGTPGAGGSQTTNEAAYTSYDRVAVTRSGAGGWTVVSNAASNTAQIQFPTATGGSSACDYVAIGTAASGARQLLAFGALGSTVTVTNNITPQFAIGALTWTAT